MCGLWSDVRCHRRIGGGGVYVCICSQSCVPVFLCRGVVGPTWACGFFFLLFLFGLAFWESPFTWPGLGWAGLAGGMTVYILVTVCEEVYEILVLLI